MKMKLFAIVALVGLVSATGTVSILDDRTWEPFVKKNKYAMIEWYAPWCGHCKALEPEYKKAASMLHNDKTRMTVLAKIDATENKFSAEAVGVNGYPTIKMFVNGVSVDYKGPRKASSIFDWTGVQEKPVAKQLTTKKKYDKFKISADFVTIAFTKKDSDESAEYNAHANEYTMTRDGIVYGEVTDEDLAKELGVKTIPSLQMFRFPASFDDLPMMVTSEWTDLPEFFEKNRFLPIDEIDVKNYKAYTSRGRPIVWMGLDKVNRSDDDEEEKPQKKWVDMLKPYAEKMTKLSFVYVDCKKFKDLCTNIGIIRQPGIVIRKTALDNHDIKYRLLDDFTEENLENFFEAYEENRLEPYVKSQKAPRIQGAIHKVVGSTYDEFVKQDKFMLLAFVAPWCQHCRELKPIYKQVAKHFNKERDDTIIAEIDATANDFPVDIKRFPTLMWYGRDSIPSEFQGGRDTAKDLIKWIKANIKDWEREQLVKERLKEDVARSKMAEQVKEATQVKKAAEKVKQEAEKVQKEAEKGETGEKTEL